MLADCSWPGHCAGDPCGVNDDCDGSLACSFGTCTADESHDNPGPTPGAFWVKVFLLYRGMCMPPACSIFDAREAW
jgi:hypothetical protein